MSALAIPLNLSQRKIDEIVSESSSLLQLIGLNHESIKDGLPHQGLALFSPAQEADKVKVFLTHCTCGWN